MCLPVVGSLHALVYCALQSQAPTGSSRKARTSQTRHVADPSPCGQKSTSVPFSSCLTWHDDPLASTYSSSPSDNCPSQALKSFVQHILAHHTISKILRLLSDFSSSVCPAVERVYRVVFQPESLTFVQNWARLVQSTCRSRSLFEFVKPQAKFRKKLDLALRRCTLPLHRCSGRFVCEPAETCANSNSFV